MPVHNPNPAYGAHMGAFAGIPTFMRQPASRNFDNIDVAVVGIPFDSGANSHRSGTRLGPRKIREMSLLMWGYNDVLSISPLEVLNLVDYGDVDVEPINIETTMAVITKEVSTILEAGPLVMSLGGDHSISLPLLRAHAAKHGPVALIHFDSHCDTSRRDKYDHGTPFRRAIEEDLINIDAYLQIGIRGPTYPGDVQAARDLGANVLTIGQCFEMGIPAIIKTIHDVVGDRPAYVTLDIDSIDPSYAPGTGTPEVGGFTSYQMLQMVRGLRGLNLIGFDLVEVNPAYDSPGEITAILAANLAFEFLSVVALGR
ncbi:MAG: agmatinase [Chloroflexota bacterium]